uniref:Uncharacterized protein n=2 Tax=Picea TaxID=3328 RepID=A0A124GP49_PICGL|nr:hypothetical protein ABT39_MTgene704 [Picea glauca]QHR90217.1 hypothetical protein Q903MT_gene4240 [Picea sitchensis]
MGAVTRQLGLDSYGWRMGRQKTSSAIPYLTLPNYLGTNYPNYLGRSSYSMGRGNGTL